MRDSRVGLVSHKVMGSRKPRFSRSPSMSRPVFENPPRNHKTYVFLYIITIDVCRKYMFFHMELLSVCEYLMFSYTIISKELLYFVR